MAETWNGAFRQIAPLADPGTNGGSELLSVSCTSPDFCFAVGETGQISGEDRDQLLQTWGPGGWQIAPGH